MNSIQASQIMGGNGAKARKAADLYPTPPEVTVALMRFLKLPGETVVWEPARGQGDMVRALANCGMAVYGTDIRDGIDFLTARQPGNAPAADWIITNPPFSLADEFIRHAAEIGKPFAMLLKAQYWHAAKRAQLFREIPPSYVLPLTWRPDFLFKERNGKKGASPLMDVMWCVWLTPQMLKMLEEAAEKQEAAEAEAAAHFKDGVKLAEENEKLRGEIGTLTEKLEENEKALEEVTAKYKSADHSAAMLRSRIDEAEKMRDQALEAHGEDMKALEKAKNESRELAKQLGERMVELKAAEENARKTAVEMNSIRAQLSEAETNAKRKEELLCAALHTIKTEKSIKEDYYKSLKWCMAHPWRNVWRCMKEYFRF